MSETTDTTVIDPVDPSSGRSPVVLALAVGGALLVGALVWFLLVAPLLGGDDVDLLEPVASGQPAAAAEAATELGEADDAPIAVTYEVLLDRDPFDPVVPRPVVEVVDTAPAVAEDGTAVDGSDDAGLDPLPVVEDGTGTGTDDGWVEGGEPPAAEPTPVVTEPAPCSVTDSGVTCDGRAVGLVRISDVDGRRVAIIQVDSTIHEVEKGEVFAANFRLGSIGEDRVTVLYGQDEFTLQVGERVLK
jgi:hypothetical protein